MKLFHWKSEDIDFFVVSISEEAARGTIKFEVGGWRPQNPARFDADGGHVITIDSLARRA
jgi:hypothetical protein